MGFLKETRQKFCGTPQPTSLRSAAFDAQLGAHVGELQKKMKNTGNFFAVLSSKEWTQCLGNVTSDVTFGTLFYSFVTSAPKRLTLEFCSCMMQDVNGGWEEFPFKLPPKPPAYPRKTAISISEATRSMALGPSADAALSWLHWTILTRRKNT